MARDLGQARTYYERASSMGSAPAREALKGLGSAPPARTAAQEEFARGATLYKSKNYAGAARVFRPLADRGYAPAQLREEAIRWFARAAEKGDDQAD